MDAPRPPRLVITGPTAVGKTDLTIALAERLGTDILSADSRQIYRELTIGTAKPSPDELQRVRHHFVDARSLTENWSAGEFAREAESVAEHLEAEGKPVIITGGSTLYIHALVEGMADIPDVPPHHRQRLMKRLANEGFDALYEQLRSVDPAAAATMDPSKTQRLVRALEVYEATGTPISEFHIDHAPVVGRYQLFILNRPRPELYARINQRVVKMVEAGLFDEVRSIFDAGFAPELNPLRTIGYQEVVEHLSGRIEEEEAIRLIQRNTRRYAKRQLTWFRRYETATWIDLGTTTTQNALHRIRSEVSL